MHDIKLSWKAHFSIDSNVVITILVKVIAAVLFRC